MIDGCWGSSVDSQQDGLLIEELWHGNERWCIDIHCFVRIALVGAAGFLKRLKGCIDWDTVVSYCGYVDSSRGRINHFLIYYEYPGI